MASILSRPQCVNLLFHVMPYGVSKLGPHWFSFWLVACSAPSHYLDQYLSMEPLKTDFYDILVQIRYTCFHWRKCIWLGNVVCKLAATLLRPQYLFEMAARPAINLRSLGEICLQWGFIIRKSWVWAWNSSAFKLRSDNLLTSTIQHCEDKAFTMVILRL